MYMFDWVYIGRGHKLQAQGTRCVRLMVELEHGQNCRPERLLMYMFMFMQYLLTAYPLWTLFREINIVHAGQSFSPPPAVITVMHATLTINWPSALR